MNVNLDAEMAIAGQAATFLHAQRLIDLGVPRGPLAQVRLRHWGYGAGRVEPSGSGLYQPEPSGERQVILPVHDEDGELVDLVAFATARPHDWRLRVGCGWALGLEHGLERFRWGDLLPLHSSPLNWLRAGGDGLCVIDWTAPEVASLGDYDTIICEDARLRSVLVEALSTPARIPTIELAEFRHAA